MSVEAQLQVPAPEFAIAGAAHIAFAASPTMLFEAIAHDASGLEIQSIALTAQVMIDPARRGYDEATRLRLSELFGPPVSWAPATSGLAWARVAAAVPGFTGATTFGIAVPCTYDLEVAAVKYFYAIEDGLVPLSFHFNGNIFYWGTGPERQLQVVPVAWSSTAQYSMPIGAWRAMIAEHYPGGGWIRLSDETLAVLHARRADHGHADFDSTVRELLSREDDARGR